MTQDQQQEDAHRVIAELQLGDDVASLEARVSDLEQELGRTRTEVGEAAAARHGELEVMRARVEDAMQVLRTTTEDQRESWSHLEERLTGVLNEIDERTARTVSALREDLEPRVHHVDVRVDELEGQLRGELDAVAEELQVRLRSATDEVDGLREELRAEIGAIRHDLERSADEVVSALTTAEERFRELVTRAEERVGGRTGELEDEVRALRGELDDEVGAVRRELDGTAGELRASLNLRAQDLEERLDAVARELAERQQAVEDRIDGRSRERGEEVGQLRSRVDELASRIEAVDQRAAGQTSRHLTELGQLHRTIEQVGGRVERLANRVDTAVEGVSGDVAARLSSVAAEVEALREAGRRQQERLGGTERLLRRLTELEDQLGSLSDRVADAESLARAAGRAIASAVRKRGPRSSDHAGTTAPRRSEPPTGS